VIEVNGLRCWNHQDRSNVNVRVRPGMRYEEGIGFTNCHGWGDNSLFTFMCIIYSGTYLQRMRRLKCDCGCACSSDGLHNRGLVQHSWPLGGGWVGRRGTGGRRKGLISNCRSSGGGGGDGSDGSGGSVGRGGFGATRMISTPPLTRVRISFHCCVNPLNQKRWQRAVGFGDHVRQAYIGWGASRVPFYLEIVTLVLSRLDEFDQSGYGCRQRGEGMGGLLHRQERRGEHSQRWNVIRLKGGKSCCWLG
jgi:hypothetical protein